MSNETVEESEPAKPAPRAVSLNSEDRRLLAALLDELLGEMSDVRPTPQPRRAE